MSLSFLSVGNERGATCYVIHGSHPSDQKDALDFQGAVSAEHPGRVVLLDKNSSESRAVIEFYAISDNRFPLALLVREDDSLAYMWSAQLPADEDLRYHLHQIGE